MGLFVGKGGDSGQNSALQKFQARAAARAHECDAIAQSGIVESFDTVAAADDAFGSIFFRGVNDGSGDIDVRNVAGSFIVESDGSGGINATDVRGSVIVRNDGSGGIDVNRVGKDFRVENKGSGDIDYADVTGTVDIPDNHRDRHYRRRGQ